MNSYGDYYIKDFNPYIQRNHLKVSQNIHVEDPYKFKIPKTEAIIFSTIHLLAFGWI